MMWSKADIKWLSTTYPGLKQTAPNAIEGRLSFQMLRLSGEYFVNPPSELVQKATSTDDVYICDTYKVGLLWEVGHLYPTVYETGGRISSVAKKLGKEIIDMHQYPLTGDLCLASTMELEQAFQQGFKMEVLIEEFVIPYLFAQSHYAKNREWLWGELSHDFVGVLEWLARRENADDRDILSTYNTLLRFRHRAFEINQLLKIGYRGHVPCPCSSEKRTRKCHPELRIALERIQDGVRRKIIKQA